MIQVYKCPARIRKKKIKRKTMADSSLTINLLFCRLVNQYFLREGGLSTNFFFNCCHLPFFLILSGFPFVSL